MLIKIGSAYVNPAEIAAIEPDRDDSLPDYERARKIYVSLKSGPSFWTDATMDEAEAALIDAGCIENPYPEDVDPPAMTEDELDELRSLSRDGFGFLARDYDHRLYAYRNRPVHDALGWHPEAFMDGGLARVCGKFDFVSKHDAEPTEIAPLLAGDQR